MPTSLRAEIERQILAGKYDRAVLERARDIQVAQMDAEAPEC